MDLVEVAVMTGGLCGYPVFQLLLVKEYFTLAGNYVKLKGVFEKTSCLLIDAETNENNNMFLHNL